MGRGEIDGGDGPRGIDGGDGPGGIDGHDAIPSPLPPVWSTPFLFSFLLIYLLIYLNRVLNFRPPFSHFLYFLFFFPGKRNPSFPFPPCLQESSSSSLALLC
jgi:hypothetical protein